MDNNTTVSQEGFQTLEDYNDNHPEDEQLTLFNLQEMTVKNTNSIESLQTQLNTAKEMYEDTFGNNPQYREEAKKVEEAQKALKAVKVQIQRQPGVITQEQKIKEIRNEIKEKKETVSALAMEVFRKTGSKEFTAEDGATYEIKTVAKLVKRKQ